MYQNINNTFKKKFFQQAYLMTCRMIGIFDPIIWQFWTHKKFPVRNMCSISRDIVLLYGSLSTRCVPSVETLYFCMDHYPQEPDE